MNDHKEPLQCGARWFTILSYIEHIPRVFSYLHTKVFDLNRMDTVLLYLNDFKNNTHFDQLVISRIKILEDFQYTLVYLMFRNSL